MNHEATYFERAAGWANDQQDASRKSRRIAWMVAGGALGLAALQSVALVMLTPLKTVQPITLLVDRQTGFVQAIDPQSPRRIAADDMLTQSLLAQYVTAREGFDRATLAADYRKVALLSAGSAREAYLAQMPATNPLSPLRRLPAGAVVAVHIKSVSKLEPGVALVRFGTEQQSSSSGVARANHWISVVRYTYSDSPMNLGDRLVNPLGFKAISYRRNAEAPPTDAFAAPERAASPSARPILQAPVPSVEAAPATQPSLAPTEPPIMPQGVTRPRPVRAPAAALRRAPPPSLASALQRLGDGARIPSGSPLSNGTE